MAKPEKSAMGGKPKQPNVFALLKPYSGLVGLLVGLTVAGNALNLAIPKLIGAGIDSYSAGTFDLRRTVLLMGAIAVGLLALTYLQSVVQAFLSERAARNLRTQIIAKVSRQDYAYIQAAGPAKLLTNLTSDADSVKNFIAQAVSSLISSAFLIIGASALLLMTDWKLALAVLACVPAIGFVFMTTFAKIRKLFLRAQETIDWLNKVINESILGAALIRILNSQQPETQKFLSANSEARDVGLGILRLFASLIPVITFFTNLATVLILALGGRFVILGSMSLGSLTAFYNYLSILIFPIIVIGFTSSVIAQAAASYGRIAAVLEAPEQNAAGRQRPGLTGRIAVRGLSLSYAGKAVVKEVSLETEPGSRTAIIGPTAAGKTQLLYMMIGLVEPSAGRIEYDGIALPELDRAAFHRQVGFVFQDSIIFSLTIRENISFSNQARDEDIEKAIATAELGDFLEALPAGLDTLVSERGSSLSGGQKQRIMLARALALNPKILFLDDFTARLDAATEKKVLGNLRANYPGLTLISVTQKVSSIEDYDRIILLEDGEAVASGKHEELLASSPEYAQICESQRSTSHYDLST